MQVNLSDQLRRAISHERLDAYRQRGSSNDNVELFAHYAWNMALSESLYTPLQCLEVSLRNGIHDAASAQFKKSRDTLRNIQHLWEIGERQTVHAAVKDIEQYLDIVTMSSKR